MAEIGDINSLYPLWPPRPADRGEPKKKQPPKPKVERKPSDRNVEEEEDGRHHIDEYA